MPFALQSSEPLFVDIRRLLSDQLTTAIRYLSTQDPHPDGATQQIEAVHETRKCIKRARTLLRLLRGALGRHDATELNARLRQLGHVLAPIRDTHMLLEAIDRLGRYADGSPFGEAVGPVRDALHARHPPHPLSEEVLGAVVPELQAIAEELDTHLSALRADRGAAGCDRVLRRSIQAGLRRQLRRARGAFALAYSAQTDSHFHDWRKRVKDVYYAACLLHPTRPQKLGPLVDSLDQLSEALGDEHDLGILATRLHSDPLGGVVAVALTLQLIARRREALRAECRTHGLWLGKRGPQALSRFLCRGLSPKRRSRQAARSTQTPG